MAYYSEISYSDYSHLKKATDILAGSNYNYHIYQGIPSLISIRSGFLVIEECFIYTDTGLSGMNFIPKGGITPAGEEYTYSANDISVGDVDGEYEYIVKWDPLTLMMFQ